MEKISKEQFNYRSDEELYVHLWLTELMEAGYVTGFDYENKEWKLSEPFEYLYNERLVTKEKKTTRVWMNGHAYGCDFTVYWRRKASQYFIHHLGDPNVYNKDVPLLGDVPVHEDSTLIRDLQYRVYMEVKPEFDQNNMEREFRINQKWVYEKYGDYVNLIKPVGTSTCLFAKTFTPQRYLYTNATLKPRKISHKVRTLNQYLNEVERKAKEKRWDHRLRGRDQQAVLFD